jgi:DNA-binding LacI/PurR family transcriptional regulator
MTRSHARPRKGSLSDGYDPAMGTKPHTATPRNPLSSGRPTLEQVALRAGVSRATVSRVVNRAKSVDPHLVEVVNQAIADLHYVPNQAARSLMTRRSDTIALIAAESDTRVFGDPFFSAIVRGVSQEASRAGVQLMLSMAQRPEDLRRLESYLQAGHVDGALLISEHDRLEVVPHVLLAGVPLVVGGRPLRDAANVLYVDHDNHRGAVLAAQRLRDIGRRHVGTIAGPQDMAAGVDRLKGFQDGLGEAFDASLVEVGDFTTPSGAEAVARLLARRPDVDGIFVASDLMALGAIGALRAAGRRVPEDVAVVGFDDSDLAAVSSPPLTTVRQRTTEQGRLMAQVLLRTLGREIEDPMPELEQLGSSGHVILPVELIERDTA